MIKRFSIVFFCINYIFGFTQPLEDWNDEKIVVINNDENQEIMQMHAFINASWDKLPQIVFWKKIMKMSSDSCLVNRASNREVLLKIHVSEWRGLSRDKKMEKRNYYKKKFNLPADEYVYVTSGKCDFYKFKEVYPSIAPGVLAFENNGVDPWYAQAILLIESPAQLKKSVVGAYGAFQLMPSVARSHGIIVNKKIDERKDFNKSAFAASNLIKNTCIPHAKKILDAHDLIYRETDLWFRLFVLHIYHAGAYNVRAVVDKINPKEGGQKLIQSMWHTKAAKFGNNSQNYSQVAVAAQLMLHDMVHKEFDDVYSCH